MTPLQFEQAYAEEWAELEVLLGGVLRAKAPPGTVPAPVQGARVAALYRRACEQLALARARSYPAYIVNRLERMTGSAHQLIYQRRDFGLARIRDIAAFEFPAAVRDSWSYVAVAAAAFVLPTILVAMLVRWQPELILSVVRADTAASFEGMYSPSAQSIGRERAAATDWMMFGFYVRNNVGVAFQCFAGGLFVGIGSLFFLIYNGAFSGALAGFLMARGLAPTFFSFVVTHSAFELTAIVLSGAAGLKMGRALLVPGRLSRLQALVAATRDSAILLYGVVVFLLIAAMIEAFWSSAPWLPHAAKYASGAVCWIAVFGYFAYRGRRAH